MILVLSTCTNKQVQAQSVSELTSQEFYDMKTTGQFALILDVRSESEWTEGHIENATLVADFNTLMSNSPDKVATLQELNIWNCRSCQVAVYCRSGARARTALNHLVSAGFDGNLYNGLGVSQWTDAGYELVTDDSNQDWPCMTADINFDDTNNNEGDTAISKQGVDENDSYCASPTIQQDNNNNGNGNGDNGDGKEDYQELQEELDTAKDLFLARMQENNSTTYSFLFTLNCFCPPADYPWLVTAQMQYLMMGVKPPPPPGFNSSVQDVSMLVMPPAEMGTVVDTVVSAITTGDADVVQIEDTYLDTYSILDLFDKIQDAIDIKAAQINVVYNLQWGYPEEIFFDYNEKIMDDEISIGVTSFTVIQKPNEPNQGGGGNGESGGGDAGGPTSPLQTELDEAYALWTSYNLDEYYFQYEWQTQIMSSFPWSVHVQDGSVVSATDGTGDDIMMEPGAGRTMEDMFATVQRGIDEDAFELEVTYDDTYGYPNRIWIDFDSMMADEEVFVTVPYFSITGFPYESEFVYMPLP